LNGTHQLLVLKMWQSSDIW